MRILLIPILRIFVPLYEGEDLQKIVDDPSSAAFFRLGEQDCIADHCHQGFANLAKAKPGTEAWILSDGSLRKYVCTKTQTGRLIEKDGGHYLRDAEGQPVYKQNEGGLCIYTCTGKKESEITYVILTYWV